MKRALRSVTCLMLLAACSSSSLGRGGNTVAAAAAPAGTDDHRARHRLRLRDAPDVRDPRHRGGPDGDRRRSDHDDRRAGPLVADVAAQRDPRAGCHRHLEGRTRTRTLIPADGHSGGLRPRLGQHHQRPTVSTFKPRAPHPLEHGLADRSCTSVVRPTGSCTSVAGGTLTVTSPPGAKVNYFDEQGVPERGGDVVHRISPGGPPSGGRASTIAPGAQITVHRQPSDVRTWSLTRRRWRAAPSAGRSRPRRRSPATTTRRWSSSSTEADVTEAVSGPVC